MIISMKKSRVGCAVILDASSAFSGTFADFDVISPLLPGRHRAQSFAHCLERVTPAEAWTFRQSPSRASGSAPPVGASFDWESRSARAPRPDPVGNAAIRTDLSHGVEPACPELAEESGSDVSVSTPPIATIWSSFEVSARVGSRKPVSSKRAKRAAPPPMVIL